MSEHFKPAIARLHRLDPITKEADTAYVHGFHEDRVIYDIVDSYGYRWNNRALDLNTFAARWHVPGDSRR